MVKKQDEEYYTNISEHSQFALGITFGQQPQKQILFAIKVGNKHFCGCWHVRQRYN